MPAQAPIDVRLLGRFQVVVGDRPVAEAAWRQRKPAALVKLLALAPAHRLHREQVLEALWPDLDPEAAANNLRGALHHARRQLEAAGATPGAFLARAGEALSLGPAELVAVDVDAFEAAAARAWRGGDPAACLAAAERYGGDLLPEDPYEDWLEARRPALRAAYLALLRRAAELLEARDAFGPAVAALERAVAAEPLDEGLQAALIRLLARAGRPREALARYERLVVLLARELAADPEPTTRDLAAAIRDGRFPPAAPAPPARPVPAEPTPPASLPAPVDALIGRERELAELQRLLTTGRLVTLTGPGGVGKTRLALAAAHALAAGFPDGARFVDLSPVRDPSLVLPAIAVALGVREEGGQPLPARVAAYLGPRRTLLVLDNFEQVVAAAGVVADLLAACPQLKVLATSRIRLRLRGEREYPVAPLALPEPGALPPSEALSQYAAVALFIERAREARPGFAVTNATAPAVAGICARLDGLPLAIELAAARVRVLPPPELLARLDRPLALLTDGARDLPERQRTIRATIAWSHDLLTADEQVLFRRIGAFAGGWTLAAAEAVGNADGLPPVDVLGGLAALVDHSLATTREGADGAVRYGMLETIREFAAERLTASGEEEDVRAAHAAWFLALAEEAERRQRGAEYVAWLDRLGQDYPNLRTALEWALTDDPLTGLRLATALAWFWGSRRHVDEGRELLVKALNSDAGEPTPLRARALLQAARLAELQGDLPTAETFLEQAQRLSELAGYTEGIAEALLARANYGHFRNGEPDAAACEAALRLFRSLDHPWGAEECLGTMANLSYVRGDRERAEALLEEALASSRRRGNLRDATTFLSGLAGFAVGFDDLARAATLGNEVLAIFADLGDVGGTAYTRWLVGIVAHGQGDFPGAAAHFREALHWIWESGHDGNVGGVLASIGHLAASAGRPDRAVRLLGAAAAAPGSTVRLDDPSREGFDQGVASVRTALGDDRFEAGWAAGQALPPRASIDEALALTDELAATAVSADSVA